MTPNGLSPDPPGREFFNRNRTKYPPDQLLPYTNLYVAWQADGTRILASGSSLDELEDQLRASNINPNQVVIEFIVG